jgi:hypothetical protein
VRPTGVGVQRQCGEGRLRRRPIALVVDDHSPPAQCELLRAHLPDAPGGPCDEANLAKEVVDGRRW